MKKIFETIKLLHYKSLYLENGIELPERESWFVLYTDGTYEYCFSKTDLISILEKDHIKRVDCIFSTNDKYTVERDIKVSVDNK